MITVKTITEIACKIWELDNDAKRMAKDISRLEASIEQPQIVTVQTPPFGRRWTGSGLKLSQLERLCIKFELRCHWCRKICDRSDPSLIPRRDRLVNFVKGKNAFSNLVLSCTGCIWRRYPETAPEVSAPSSSRPRPYRPSPRRRIYPWTERAFIDRLVWLKTRGYCFYCKTPVSYSYPETPMVKDHYVPLFHSGHDDHSNLVPACKFCDKNKGHTLPWEFTNRFTGKPLVCFPKPIVEKEA